MDHTSVYFSLRKKGTCSSKTISTYSTAFLQVPPRRRVRYCWEDGVATLINLIDEPVLRRFSEAKERKMDEEEGKRGLFLGKCHSPIRSTMSQLDTGHMPIDLICA